jgi:hypothetical protein
MEGLGRSSPIEKSLSEPESRSEDRLERVRLQQGSTVTLAFDFATGVKVSRKGVINLYHLGQGSWQITGLRKGLVVIENQRRAGESPGALGKRYLVEVIDTEGRGRNDLEEGGLSSESLLPQWICQRPGVRCDQGKRLVEGVAQNREFWLKSFEFCLNLTGCDFKMKLSPALKLDWQRQLSDLLGQGVEIKNLDPSGLLVLGDCSQTSVKKWEELTEAKTGVKTQAGVLVVGCLEDHYRGLFQVSIDVISVKESSTNQQGIDSREQLVLRGGASLAQGGAPGVTLGVDGAIFSRLVHLMATDKARVMAQPVIRLMSSTPTRLLSGGEFAYRTQRGAAKDSGKDLDPSEGATEWKAMGLDLGLEVFPLSQNKVSLKYETSLKSKIDQGSVHVQALKGRVELPLGQKVLIGRIDMDQQIDGDEGSLLSEIPIIGQLFHSSHKEVGNSVIFLWATIERITQTY